MAQWRRIRWGTRVTVGVLESLATAYVAVQASGDGSAASWYSDDRYLLPAAVVLGVGSLLTVADGVRQYQSEKREGAIARQLDRYSYVLHREISRKLRPQRKRQGVTSPSRRTLNRIGITVWMVPPWFVRIDNGAPGWVRRISGRRIRSPHLLRISSLRIVDEINPTGIKWHRGLGLIGHVWRTRRVHALSMAEKWPAVTTASAPDAWSSEWELVPGDYRYGLKSDQARRIRENYSAAMAAPIWHRDAEDGSAHVVGVLTVDVPNDVSDLDIHSQALENLVRTASNRMGRVMK